MSKCAYCEHPWTEWISLCEDWFCSIECLVKHSSSCSWCLAVKARQEKKDVDRE